MLIREEIVRLRELVHQELCAISTAKDLENLKVKYLGKKGPIQALMLELKNASSEERPHLGKLINELKEECASELEKAFHVFQKKELEERLLQERIDVTLPGKSFFVGRQHPITQTIDQALDILIGMGFSVRYGPNIDSDYYNFGGLNFAADHPARDMQDTFYVSEDILLRTHTSNVQVHTMEEFAPPIRVIAPGRCFRNETISSRSHVFFHQIEGFYIDRNVTFADLFATMEEFWNKLLGEKVKMRFRPSYFPFVEPGLEVDVSCTSCKGKGCKICKHTGWLEVCGAGMIHPNVLKKGNIDPEVYSGYAWGMGIERPAILKYNISDIRYFTRNDLRFLSQFS